jgi:hypothetical protein
MMTELYRNQQRVIISLFSPTFHDDLVLCVAGLPDRHDLGVLQVCAAGGFGPHLTARIQSGP